MAGAKSETAIITISTNFSFVSYDNDKGILMFHFLIGPLLGLSYSYIVFKVDFAPYCFKYSWCNQ